MKAQPSRGGSPSLKAQYKKSPANYMKKLKSSPYKAVKKAAKKGAR